jgi:ADP-ribosylglycohydrolase
MKRKLEFFRGCLLGGAVGDALGWTVEFLKYKEIIRRYGDDGIRDLVCAPSGKAEITDDTQMTLFTAEGILRAETRGDERGICHVPTVVYHAYQRWLHTQGYPRWEDQAFIYNGWLLDVKELHVQRAPGNTCLSALWSRKLGTVEQPVNKSKGCGGVMRVAPAGLFYPTETAFRMGMDFAAITHGHPSGYLASGALSLIISYIIRGDEMESAVRKALEELKKYDHHEECYQALEEAVRLAFSDLEPVEAIHKLGEGWVAEEALAISVYCALKFKHDFKEAIIAAVNHNGDSDSTGAITGNILGAYLGMSAIPNDWLDKVELKEVITQVADDLLTGYQHGQRWRDRYPGC